MNSRPTLPRKIIYAMPALAMLLLVAVAAFGWWAASRIDDEAIAHETRAIRNGIAEVVDRIPTDQETVTVWDDAVLQVRVGDPVWIDDNLTAWVSDYYGHDYVFLLGADDQPLRAAAGGEAVGPEVFASFAALAPLVSDLRARMAETSEGLADSTAAVTGLGASDFILLDDGRVAAASVRPVIPSTDRVSQAPGSEAIHISVRLLDQDLLAEIADRYDIHDLTFEAGATTIADRAAIPVSNSAGRILGVLAWEPREPAFQLIRDTAPVMLGSVVMAGLGLLLLLGRLRSTSNQLETTQARASFLAFHDPLTGIPNRALFEDRLEQALANARRTGSSLAVHYIDLDHFKHVNDTLGHPAGDQLIRQAARRLCDLVEEVDTVARLGGDEFAVIQFETTHPEAEEMSQRIVAALEEPFELDGHTARCGGSVGVVVTDASQSPEEILRQADIALYEAKGNGRGRAQLFAGELGDAVRERRMLELDLRMALLNDTGLELVYQPIFEASTGEMAGAEALVRWEHATRGRMSPATFIPLAEERGLIDMLGFWVMRQACAYAVATGLPWVAVNVSPVQFRDERFAERVFEILAETGLKPKRLELEITEGLLLQNSPMVQETLRHLRASGIRVALDDFGTGYSSISYLRNHGVDKLKIDQSFTAQLGKDAEIESIMRSIIDLGRAMHMKVTAEGVETEQQQQMLQEMGCNQLQGYLLSRPLTSERLAEQFAAAGSPAVRRA
ncbi:putative bifunctional diguanylate cyclase/phosphodiesterase [Devosia albogilva]|uniref:Bifunctional diguanylate cyclase/phosphodiesterase n=1 Tax=Devosia albogilva TaxID=429726 RepID=A0ABW5QJ20_9HYPH